jgi:hypothetical protein
MSHHIGRDAPETATSSDVPSRGRSRQTRDACPRRSRGNVSGTDRLGCASALRSRTKTATRRSPSSSTPDTLNRNSKPQKVEADKPSRRTRPRGSVEREPYRSLRSVVVNRKERSDLLAASSRPSKKQRLRPTRPPPGRSIARQVDLVAAGARVAGPADQQSPRCQREIVSRRDVPMKRNDLERAAGV